MSTPPQPQSPPKESHGPRGRCEVCAAAISHRAAVRCRACRDSFHARCVPTCWPQALAPGHLEWCCVPCTQRAWDASKNSHCAACASVAKSSCVVCRVCARRFAAACAGLDKKQMRRLIQSPAPWSCAACETSPVTLLPTIPYKLVAKKTDTNKVVYLQPTTHVALETRPLPKCGRDACGRDACGRDACGRDACGSKPRPRCPRCKNATPPRKREVATAPAPGAPGWLCPACTQEDWDSSHRSAHCRRFCGGPAWKIPCIACGRSFSSRCSGLPADDMRALRRQPAPWRCRDCAPHATPELSIKGTEAGRRFAAIVRGAKGQELERFADAYLHHLIYKLKDSEERDLAYAALAAALGVADASPAHMLRLCGRFLAQYHALLKVLISPLLPRVTLSARQVCCAALRQAPEWLRRAEKKLARIKDVVKMSLPGAQCPRWLSEAEVALEQPPDLIPPLQPGAVLAALASGCARGRSLQRTAAALALPPHQLQACWDQYREACMLRLQALTPGTRLEPREWAVVDAELLATHHRLHWLVADAEGPAQAALLALLELVHTHALEDEHAAHKRQRWLQALQQYQERGFDSSLVCLQRRWWELKMAARELVTRYWRARYCTGTQPSPDRPAGLPPALHRTLVARYPHVVTGAARSWRELVLAGAVHHAPARRRRNTQHEVSESPDNNESLKDLNNLIDTMIIDDDETDLRSHAEGKDNETAVTDTEHNENVDKHDNVSANSNPDTSKHPDKSNRRDGIKRIDECNLFGDLPDAKEKIEDSITTMLSIDPKNAQACLIFDSDSDDLMTVDDDNNEKNPTTKDVENIINIDSDSSSQNIASGQNSDVECITSDLDGTSSKKINKTKILNVNDPTVEIMSDDAVDCDIEMSKANTSHEEHEDLKENIINLNSDKSSSSVNSGNNTCVNSDNSKTNLKNENVTEGDNDSKASSLTSNFTNVNNWDPNEKLENVKNSIIPSNIEKNICDNDKSDRETARESINSDSIKNTTDKSNEIEATISENTTDDTASEKRQSKPINSIETEFTVEKITSNSDKSLESSNNSSNIALSTDVIQENVANEPSNKNIDTETTEINTASTAISNDSSKDSPKNDAQNKDKEESENDVPLNNDIDAFEKFQAMIRNKVDNICEDLPANHIDLIKKDKSTDFETKDSNAESSIHRAYLFEDLPKKTEIEKETSEIETNTSKNDLVIATSKNVDKNEKISLSDDDSSDLNVLKEFLLKELKKRDEKEKDAFSRSSKEDISVANIDKTNKMDVDENDHCEEGNKNQFWFQHEDDDDSDDDVSLSRLVIDTKLAMTPVVPLTRLDQTPLWSHFEGGSLALRGVDLSCLEPTASLLKLGPARRRSRSPGSERSSSLRMHSRSSRSRSTRSGSDRSSRLSRSRRASRSRSRRVSRSRSRRSEPEGDSDSSNDVWEPNTDAEDNLNLLKVWKRPTLNRASRALEKLCTPLSVVLERLPPHVLRDHARDDAPAPSPDQLLRLLRDMEALARDRKMKGKKYCCEARRHRALNDARRRVEFAKKPDLQHFTDINFHGTAHNHGASPCLCCCTALLEATPATPFRLARIQRQLEQRLRALLAAKPVPAKKRKPNTDSEPSSDEDFAPRARSQLKPQKPPKPPKPPKRPSKKERKRREQEMMMAEEEKRRKEEEEKNKEGGDLGEWIRQKNINKRFFTIIPPSKAQSSVRRTKLNVIEQPVKRSSGKISNCVKVFLKPEQKVPNAQATSDVPKTQDVPIPKCDDVIAIDDDDDVKIEVDNTRPDKLDHNYAGHSPTPLAQNNERPLIEVNATTGNPILKSVNKNDNLKFNVDSLPPTFKVLGTENSTSQHNFIIGSNTGPSTSMFNNQPLPDQNKTQTPVNDTNGENSVSQTTNYLMIYPQGQNQESNPQPTMVILPVTISINQPQIVTNNVGQQGQIVNNVGQQGHIIVNNNIGQQGHIIVNNNVIPNNVGQTIVNNNVGQQGHNIVINNVVQQGSQMVINNVVQQEPIKKEDKQQKYAIKPDPQSHVEIVRNAVGKRVGYHVRHNAAQQNKEFPKPPQILNHILSQADQGQTQDSSLLFSSPQQQPQILNKMFTQQHSKTSNNNVEQQGQSQKQAWSPQLAPHPNLKVPIPADPSAPAPRAPRAPTAPTAPRARQHVVHDMQLVGAPAQPAHEVTVNIPVALPPPPSEPLMPRIASVVSLAPAARSDDAEDEAAESPACMQSFPSALFPPGAVRVSALLARAGAEPFALLRLDDHQPVWTLPSGHIVITDSAFACDNPSYYVINSGVESPRRVIFDPPTKTEPKAGAAPPAPDASAPQPRIKVKAFAKMPAEEPAAAPEALGASFASGLELVRAEGRLFRRLTLDPPIYARVLTGVSSVAQAAALLQQGALLHVLQPRSNSLHALQQPRPRRLLCVDRAAARHIVRAFTEYYARAGDAASAWKVARDPNAAGSDAPTG